MVEGLWCGVEGRHLRFRKALPPPITGQMGPSIAGRSIISRLILTDTAQNEKGAPVFQRHGLVSSPGLPLHGEEVIMTKSSGLVFVQPSHRGTEEAVMQHMIAKGFFFI